MRIALTDGEMTNLDADGWGQLLCACVAEYQTPGKSGRAPWCNVRTFTLGDYKGKRWDDKSLALEWSNALTEYDIVVSWNGVKFDEPFLRTRLKEYGLVAAPWKRHKDLMYTARFKLKMSSASLKNVEEFLDIHRKYNVAKTPLVKKCWRMAICGHEESYKRVVQHCQNDVKVLAAVWRELAPWITEIK